MLPLPKGLIISRNHQEEQALLDKARTHLEKNDRSGIHMSDLMDIRLAYWKKVKAQPMPDRLVNIFLVGQVLHTIIEVIKEGDGDYSKPPDSGTKYFEDIRYSPDFLNFKGEPDEIKTTRSPYPPRQAYLPDDATFHQYCEQLLGYMACEDKTSGHLTILYLNLRDEEGKTAPQIYVWTVETSPEALAALRKVLVKTKEQLQAAIEAGSDEALPLCRKWKCGPKMCEYWADCKPQGRYGLTPKDWKE